MAGTQTKYFSVYNDGTQDLTVKDAEARASVTSLRNYCDDTFSTKKIDIDGPLYIGAGSDVDDVIQDESCIYEDEVGLVPIDCSSEYIFILYPSSNTDISISLLMNSFPVPMEEDDEETIDGVEYCVLKSSLAYSYTGNLSVNIEQKIYFGNSVATS